MKDDTVLKEILELKRDQGLFNDRLIELRYQDFKAAFIDQMRQVVSEEGLRSFDLGLQIMDSRSDCVHKKNCIGMLGSIIEESIQALKRDDLQTAMSVLDKTESIFTCGNDQCTNEACSATAGESIRKVKAILTVYIRLASDVGSRGHSITRSPPTEGARLTPEQLETVLSPLANAHRIEILRILSADERSLSEISRELGLKAGHLLFHIRVLKDSGFISQDRKGRHYSLAPRGATALKATSEMVAKVVQS